MDGAPVEEGIVVSLCDSGCTVRMVAYIEEVKLINSGSNAPCEQQDIALQPCHGFGRVLVERFGSRHCLNLWFQTIVKCEEYLQLS
jgi:hypothetical protein